MFNIQNMIKGEMLINTLPTPLLQIFCKITLNSKVIVKSILDTISEVALMG